MNTGAALTEVAYRMSVIGKESVDAAAASIDKMAVSEEKLTRATTASEAGFARLQAKLDPAIRNQQAYQKTLEQVARYEEAGIGTAEARATVIDLATRKLIEQTAALQRASQAQDQYNRAAQSANSAGAINARLGVRDEFGSVGRSQDIAVYGSELDQLRAKYNPLFAAGQQYKQTLAEIDRALRVGAISEKERANAVMDTKVAFVQQVNSLRGVRDEMDRSSGATGRLAAGTGLARHELINLSRQAQDVGVSLASGQSPFTVLVQQGTQVADVFASSNGTVGGFFKQAVSWLGSFLSVGRLAFGGVALAIGGAIMALSSYAAAQREVQRGLFGQGQASGATVNSINNIAGQSATPFGLSVSEAREVATALAATGKIGVAAIGGIVVQAHDLSIVLGGDLKAATQLLAKAYADPVKGAAELNQHLGFLDAKTQAYINTLVAQGDRQRAIQVLTDAAAPSLARAAELTTGWARAWNAVSNAASNAYSWMGKALSGATPEENVARLQARIDALQARPRGMGVRRNDTELNDAQRQLAELQAQIKRTADAAIDAANRQRSLEIQVLIDGVTQEIQVRRDLEDKVKNVAKAMGDPAFAAHTRDMAQAAQALERYKGALDTLMTPMQRETEQAKISLDAVKARSPAQLADIAARQKALELAGQELTTGERQTKIDNARLQASTAASFQLQEAANSRLLGAQQRVDAAQLELRIIGASSVEQERQRSILQAKQQLEQDALRTYGSRDAYDRKHLDALTQQINKEAEIKRHLAEQQLHRDMQFERSQLGRDPIESTVASRLRSTYGDDYINKMNSAEAAELRLNEQLKIGKDASVEFFGGLARDAANGKNVLESLNGALGRLRDRFIDMAINNIAAKAFEGAGTGGGGFGLFSLFGGGAAPMNIGNAGGTGGILGGIYHSGGIAGRPMENRIIHPAYYENAPRYHSGGIAGLAPDEVPAILRRGEPVFKDMEHARQAVGGGRASVSVKIINNGAPVEVENQRENDDGEIELTVRAITRDEMASGRTNGINSSKYGQRPRLKAR